MVVKMKPGVGMLVVDVVVGCTVTLDRPLTQQPHLCFSFQCCLLVLVNAIIMLNSFADFSIIP